MGKNARHHIFQDILSGWVSLPKVDKAEVLRKVESIALLGSNNLDSLVMAILIYLYDEKKIEELCEQREKLC